MQRSIDSFFKKVPPQKRATLEPESPIRTKRKARVIVSSDEDEVADSPQNGETSNMQQKKKSRPEDSHKEKTKTPSPSSKELKRVNPWEIFDVSATRLEVKKMPKHKATTEVEMENSEIDKSLLQIDLNEPASQVKTPEKKRSPENVQKTPENRNKDADVKSDREKAKKDKVKSPPSNKKPKLEDIWKEETKEENHSVKSEKDKHASSEHFRKDHTDLESSVLSDEERYERKRASTMLYQKYKNRQAVINPGSKEVPKGKANCLAGLTFLVTGVLESLERDEASSIIKDYGGKMMTVVGKRLNYLIAGEEAGPKKLAQAEQFNIPILSEDGLFDLIREKSGLPSLESLQNIKKDNEKPSTSKRTKKEKHGEENDESPKKEIPLTENKKIVKKEKISPLKSKQPIILEPKSIVKDEKVSPLKSKQFDVPELKVVREDTLALVDKYKPTSVKDIIGQQGAASCVAKLTSWLSKWYTNHDGKKKLQKPNPWAKNDDGGFYKAALLSGPPGVGKTTTATLVCQELGFDAVEFNASDTRSKRLLKEEVAELLSNKSLYGFCHGNTQAVTKKHVLLMDEVDGMAGNEDRGGIQELIGLIKDSSVPIICMCNDRNHPKMRSLVNYCYDLRFNKPRIEQIKARILSICFKEKIKIDSSKIEEIIAATNNDIRQSINHISLLSADKNLDNKADKIENQGKTAEKNLKLGPWEVVRKVFSPDEHKNMTFQDKLDLFFHDYSLAPLFVQQNYLLISPTGPKSDLLQKVANTADALSLGDLVDKRIRSDSAWSLLPTLAAFTSVMPGEFMTGYFTKQINFPGWLGKNSRSTKRKHLAQELQDHTRVRTSASRLSIRLDYAPFLLDKIIRPLKEKGMEGIAESLAIIKEYHLLRDDLDTLVELTSWPGKKNPMDLIDGRVKAALTRTYNKEVLAYTYSVTANIRKKKIDTFETEAELMMGEGEEEKIIASEDEENEEDNLENDGLIKAKKKVANASKTTTPKTTGTKKSTTKAKTSTKTKN